MLYVGLLEFSTVNAQCNADFAYINLGYEHGFAFYPQESGFDSVKWVFLNPNGRNETSTNRSGGYVYYYSGYYGQQGFFEACRYVSDSTLGCKDTTCMIITFGDTMCRSLFTYEVHNDSVQFVNKSRNVGSLLWNFGDGDTSTKWNPNHTYLTAGTYNVLLTIIDTNGTYTDTYSQLVIIKDNCDATWVSSYQGMSRTFDIVYPKNSNVRYKWTFGNGDSSYDHNPTYTYSQPGTYNVCLEMYDSILQCSDSFCDSIAVDTAHQCSVFWNYFYDKHLYDSFVYFNNIRTNNTTNMKWYFPDGRTSTEKQLERMSLSHLRNQNSKKVCLSVVNRNTGCKDALCKDVKLIPQRRCIASFSIGDSTIYSGLDTLAQLTNQSLGLTHFTWTFPNGDTSSNRHESLVIKAPGTYTICLAGRDSVTGCTDTLCRTITIDSAKNCRASFRIAVDTSQKFKLFLINGSSNKTSHQYYWSFGDGGTSTQRNPTHKYTSFGKYNVCLTVYDSTLNCTATYCDSLGLDSSGRLLKANGFELEVIDDFLSAPTVENIEFTISPNPTTSAVSVKLAELKGNNAYAKVYNLQGELVQEARFNTETLLSLDLSQEVDGLYLIHLFDGKNHVQTKLIKMNK